MGFAKPVDVLYPKFRPKAELHLMALAVKEVCSWISFRRPFTCAESPTGPGVRNFTASKAGQKMKKF